MLRSDDNMQNMIGNCDGYNFIETEAQCAAAAAAWLLPGTVTIATSGTEVPHGCFYDRSARPSRLRSRRSHLDSQRYLWFNPNGNRTDDDATRSSLCRKLSHVRRSALLYSCCHLQSS